MDFYSILTANLVEGDVVYTTSEGTSYMFKGWSKDGSLKYSINNGFKYIPKRTLMGCKQASIHGIFNLTWFKEYYANEYASRPCNLKVIEQLIENYSVT